MFHTFTNVKQHQVYKTLLDRSNHSTLYCDGITYGIDWNTGLSWMHVSNQGCPVYADSFRVIY